MGVAGSAGLSVLALQIVLYRQAPKGTAPLEAWGVPAAEASDQECWQQRVVSALGSVHIGLFAGLGRPYGHALLGRGGRQAANLNLLSPVLRRIRRKGSPFPPNTPSAISHQPTADDRPGCHMPEHISKSRPEVRPEGYRHRRDPSLCIFTSTTSPLPLPLSTARNLGQRVL